MKLSTALDLLAMAVEVYTLSTSRDGRLLARAAWVQARVVSIARREVAHGDDEQRVRAALVEASQVARAVLA